MSLQALQALRRPFVVSWKAQAVSFAKLSAQELPSVRNGSCQGTCLRQWAFTF